MRIRAILTSLFVVAFGVAEGTNTTTVGWSKRQVTT